MSAPFPDNGKAYRRMGELMLSSLHVEPAARTKVFEILDSSDSIAERSKTASLGEEETQYLTCIQEEVLDFLQQNHAKLAARRIGAAWLRYRDNKRFLHYQSIYQEGRNARVHDMMQREVSYTALISQLAQRYAVPLLDPSTDSALQAESADIREILEAILDIERLHRGLLRKFRGFVEDGDWPNVDGFGNIFLDLQAQFRAYGDFILQFKYTIDLLDRMDIGQVSRPLLYQFLEKHSYDNVGFKALLSKPLNQLASYELGLQQMSQATAPEDPDFKVIMKALAIISETNKYVNTCLNQSYNTAKIKAMEQRLTIKPSRNQPTLRTLYHSLVPDAQYVEEEPVEIQMRRGVKKRAPGCLNFFTNMILICVAQKGSLPRTKRLYQIPQVRLDEISPTVLQLTALQPVEGSEEMKEVLNSSIRFTCGSIQMAREIVDRVHQLKEATQANRVFGVDLNVIIEREDRDISVPLILQTLCEYILQHFTEEVGLFRVPGSAQVEKTLRKAFNEGVEAVDLDSYNVTAADISGLIKLYFRELPCALCGDLYVKFVEVQKAHKDSEKEVIVSELTRLVMELPPNNRQTLKYMCEFMYQVAQHKETNKMDCSNVAMCVGPDLMKPPVDSIELALMIPHANEALSRLTEFSNEIFAHI